MRAFRGPAKHGTVNQRAGPVYRIEDDVETTQAAPARCSPLRASLFAIAGMLAAMLVLGIALAHG
jgi:hypothetical protein